MNNQIDACLQIMKKSISEYYCEESLETLIPYLDREVTWIGSGEEYIIRDVHKVVSHMKRNCKERQIRKGNIINEEYQILNQTKDTITIMGIYQIKGKQEWGSIIEVNQRVIFTFCINGEDVKIILMHASSPEKNIDRENKQIRIAMENSSNVIYEYDIMKDILSSYEVVETKDGKEVHKGKILNYKESIPLSDFIFEEDKKTVLEGICKGKGGEAEIRLRPPYEKRNIYTWWKMRGSVIYEQGKPVRVIGTLQNIERIKNLERDHDLLEKIIDKVVRDDYHHICILDCKNRTYKLQLPSNSNYYNLPREGTYEEKLRYFSTEIVYEKDKKAFLKGMQLEQIISMLRNGHSEYNVTYRSKDESGIRWHSVKFSYFNRENDTILLKDQDITDYKKRQQEETERTKREEERFNFLLRTMCENFIEVDIETGICTLTSPKEGIVQKGLFCDQIKEFAETVVIPEERESYLKEFELETLMEKIQLNHGLYVTYCTVQYEDGYHYLLINNTIVEGINKKYVLLYAQDITKLREEEKKSRQVIMDALAVAKQANMAKSDFLSRMSHEIRTPMNAIIGMTTLAQASLDNTHKIGEYLKKIEISAHFLLSLINDILDMSRIESGKIVLYNNKFSFAELVNGIIAIISPQVKSKEIEFNSVIDGVTEEYYIGDPLRINQVLINILSNSVKFTNRGGYIRFYISQINKKNGYAFLRFIISDTGIGMKKEFQKRLFEPFEQEDPSISVRFGGTGLGLAICKNLVDMMGGKIEVHSVEGLGSEFTVDIRLKTLDNEKEITDNQEIFDLRKRKTLVVDDDPIVCQHMALLFKNMDIEVQWVTSGKEAVEEVKKAREAKNPYEVLLVDWKMPDMDGIETVKKIREIKENQVLNIIMAAYDWADIEGEARKSGVNYFISKPVFQSDLCRVFQQIGTTESFPKKKKEEREYDFSGMKVLLVEDNEINIEIAKSILERKHIRVDTAYNGKEAVEKFINTPIGYYDLIFMDIRMPVMDGLEATKNIRAIDRTDSKEIPIIAMTANAFDEDVEKSKKSGMNAHLTKPIETEQVFYVLSKYYKK